MEQSVAYSQLSRLLSEETRLLGELEQQLAKEHEFLAANDVDSLERAGETRQQTVAKLLRVDDERRALCRMAGQATDRVGLGALLTWCDPTGTLAAAQGEAARRAEACRAQNERNGALVTARLTRVAGMLDMISNNSTARTYEPGATRNAPAPAGRLVSVSA